MEMGIDWSNLQPELLEIIASKLTIYIDYVRFRAVCVQWRSSVSPKPHHLPTQPPWLLYPYILDDGIHHCFLDLSTKKIHELSLVVSLDTRCCGSSQGWLVFVEECRPSIHLVNPLTQNVIRLPPLTTLPNVFFDIGDNYIIQPPQCGSSPFKISTTNMRDYFIRKVVLSSSPSSLENDYIALLILYEIPGLAFLKKGDEKWSIIEDARDSYLDAIYYNGSFYAITEEGSISICDISGVSPIVTLITVAESLMLDNSKTYLVDSFGELMFVTSNIKFADNDDEYESVDDTFHFSVFNYDPSKPEWAPMDTLGDRMLFLGGNSSVCLSACDFSGCKRNSIYFSFDEKYYEKSQCECDVGVYHLIDSSIVPLTYGQGRTRYFLPPPIWVIPNPY